MHRDDQKLQVQQATDIVRLIGEEVSLRPKGRELMGLCPFHDDKRPSLHVSPLKQIYKCFSCGAGGDVFSFMMMYHKMTFPEALAHLAQRAGIELNPIGSKNGSGEQKRHDKQRLTDANQWALRFFSRQLADQVSGQTVRKYLQQRGMTGEMIEAFQLGFAPGQWDALTQEMGRQLQDRDVFQRAGLVVAKREGQGVYDRFRNRLVFPILDGLGRPIAFGARRLDPKDEPKYLNSPETPLFNKSETLYGLHQAKKPIIDSRQAVVVEGYTDVIACHQAGRCNVVATLGTAFTPSHAVQLGRLCDKVVLVFDADQAGQKAADRAIAVFLNGSTDVAVAVLPQGLDPAQLLEEVDGDQRFGNLVEQAQDALQYKLSRMRHELESTDTMTGRERLVEQYLLDLTQAGGGQLSQIRRAMIAGRVSQLLGISQQVVESRWSQLHQAKRSPGRSARQPSDTSVQTQEAENSPLGGVVSDAQVNKIRALHLAERQVIGCLLRRPDLFHRPLPDGQALDEALTVTEMVTPVGKDLYGRIYQLLCGDTPFSLAQLLADLAVDENQELANLATSVEADAEVRCGDHEELLETDIREAAQSILRYHRERSYEKSRQALFKAVSDGSEAIDDSQLSRLAEHRRDHPSAVNIARISRSH